MEIYEKTLKEGKEIVEWVKKKRVKLVSAILFGSAVRRWKEPEDLDVLIVVDEPDQQIDKLYEDFREMDLTLDKKIWSISRANDIEKGINRKRKSPFLL